MSTSLLLRYMTLILGIWLMLAGVCLGKEVHLKDGGIIECESFWRRDGLVVIKINRDTVIDLERSEVNLKRTFLEAGKKSGQFRREKPARAVAPSNAAASVAEASTIAVTAPSAPAPAQAAKRAPPPASAPAPVAKETAGPEPVQPAPTDSSAPPDKAELQRQASEMMAAAIQKQDPELLKKAVEAAQKSATPEGKAQAARRSGTFLLVLLVCTLLILASMWIVYKKAGRSGVSSIVPFYNMYILMVISGKPGWWLFLMIIPLVGFAFYLLAMLGLAEKFGRGALFGIGLVFLPMFFFPMLAFGDAQYEGGLHA